MISILFVTELRVWPPYGGERIHAYNMIDSLSRFCDVTVLAPLPSADCPLLAQVAGWHDLPGVAAGFFRRVLDSRFVVMQHPAWRDRLEALLERLRPQLTWFNYGHWGHYAPLARRCGAATLMQTHNVQSRLERQGLASRPLTFWHLYYGVRYPLEAWHERRWFRRFDCILSVSENDSRSHARCGGAAASLTMPNFINEAWYHADQSAPREAGLVAMAGNFGAFQNQAGARWFVEAVWPAVQAAAPEARLALVGGAPVGWRRQMDALPGVACTGGVPAVAPYLRRAAVGIVPLRHGSGTRFKVLEALACELPLVSTTAGAEGIGLVDGVHARLADAPAAFAARVVELLADQAQRERLAANGLALLQAEYSFAVNTERLRRIVLSLVQ